MAQGRSSRPPLPPPGGWIVIAPDRGDHGGRLDQVLRRHLAHAGLSRTRLQALVDDGQVRVNGRQATRAAQRVAAGDRVEVRTPPRRVRAVPQPEDLALTVLYEDDDLLAVDKPPGLVVHPSYKHAAGTLMNALLWHAQGWPAGTRPALVQRLDRHTSGVLLVAKRPDVHAALQRAMFARKVDKDYLAVVWGRVSPPRGTIDLALDRDPWDRRRVMVTDRGGQPSRTQYERLALSRGRRRGLTLLRCRLLTGRMHQIRVHLAAKGWPIVGDPAYGQPPAEPLTDATLDAIARGFGRQALHAWRLALTHPVTGAPLVVESPLPGDMSALLAAAGLASGDQVPSGRSRTTQM